MKNRHRYELLARLERVAELGSCEIRYAELRRWFERERITRSIWSDILDYWDELCDEEASLLVGEGEGLVTLLYNDGLTPSTDSWWKDLRNWAGLEARK